MFSNKILDYKEKCIKFRHKMGYEKWQFGGSSTMQLDYFELGLPLWYQYVEILTSNRLISLTTNYN